MSGQWGEEKFLLKKSPLENFATHIEFDYFGKGNAIDLSMTNDSFYMFSKSKDYLVVKVHLQSKSYIKLIH